MSPCRRACGSPLPPEPARCAPARHLLVRLTQAAAHPRRSLAHRRPKDLLHPSLEESQPLHNGGTIHKKKRLVAGPNSFFMDVKCPGCFTINTVQT